MRLRPYIPCTDFDKIRTWAADERTHALWSAGRIKYPMQKDDFDRFLEDIAAGKGDCPFVATDDGGEPVGFFCYSVDTGTDVGMLKFVIVSPDHRGKGYGRQMIGLAVKYAFELTRARTVKLSVFSINERAIKCYQSTGFEQISMTEDAFRFGEELWGRCGMEIQAPPVIGTAK